MVEFLVEQGADINRGDNEGWTPLHATASCGFISIAKFVQFFNTKIKRYFLTFCINKDRENVNHVCYSFNKKKKCIVDT